MDCYICSPIKCTLKSIVNSVCYGSLIESWLTITTDSVNMDVNINTSSFQNS